MDRFNFEMKKFIGLILFLISYSLQAQLTVLVVNDNNGEKMPFAHVSYKDANDASAKLVHTVTNNQGKVVLPDIAGNKYYIEISFLGYAKVSQIVDKSQKEVTFSLKSFDNNLDQYVVTAHSIPTEISNTVYKMRVIGRERIETQGAVNLRDLLSNDLNIRISQDDFLGSRMTMQGIGGENVKIMIDGVPLVGRQGGNIDLSQINLNNIERIEIIEGPTSVFYGTNALGGVVNLITKKEQKEALSGTVHTFYETVGQYNIDLNLGVQFGKNTLRVGGGRYFFDGHGGANDTSRFQQWNPKEQYFADLAYTRNLGKLKFKATSWVYDEMIINRGNPRPPLLVNAIDDYFQTRRSINSIFLNGFVADNRFVDFTASHSFFHRRKNSYFRDLTTLEDVLTGNKEDHDTSSFHHLMSRATYSSNQEDRKWNYMIGYDIKYEISDGRRILNQRQDIGDFAMFASMDLIPFKRMILKPALRVAHNTGFRAPIIPSLHIKTDFGKGTQLRASYARGFRAPDLRELYLEFVDINHRIFGNPNLKAETSHNFNLMLSLSKSTDKHSLSLEPSLFYNYIENKITLVMSDALVFPPEFRNENLGLFQSTGAQVNFNYKRDRATLNTGVSYIGVYNALDEGLIGENFFTFSPEFRANINYKFPKINTNISVFYKYNGLQPFLYGDMDGNISQGFVSGFSLLDLSVSKQFFKQKLGVTIIGKNLINVTDIEQQGVIATAAHAMNSPTAPIAWGRTLAVSIRYNFKMDRK